MISGRIRNALTYPLIPIIGLAAPLLGLPVITSAYGATGWAAIAVGQSVGSAVAVVGELGWGLTGPQMVARTTQPGRLFSIASSTRIVSAVVLAPVAFGVAWVISPDHQLAAGFSALAGLWVCLSSAWFMIGLSRPALALAVDSGPRLLAVLAGSVALILGFPLWTYPLVLAVGCWCSPLLGCVFVSGARPFALSALTSTMAREMAFGQLHALAARCASAIYISAPTAILAMVSTANAVATYAAIDRIVRLVLAGLIFVPLSMQSWVGTSPPDLLMQRLKRAVAANIAVGAVAASVLFAIFPDASKLLFSGSVELTKQQMFAGAAIVAASCASRATGSIVLVRLDGVGAIAFSAIIGAIIAIPGVVYFGRNFEATGTLWWILVVEIVVLLVQIVAIILKVRQRSNTTLISRKIENREWVA